MARHYSQAAIGLEITEDMVFITQLESEETGVVVNRMRAVTIPPRTVVKGTIEDVQSLAEQIAKVIENPEFYAGNIVVAIQNAPFLKRLNKFAGSTEDDFKADVDIKVGNTYLFNQAEFSSGFQVPLEEAGASLKDHPVPVLYAAIETHIIETIRQLSELLELNLVSVDLVPLAIVRAMCSSGYLGKEPVLTVVAEAQWVDLNVVQNGNVYFTRTIFRKYEELVDNPVEFEGMLKKLRQFLLAYENFYPGYESVKRVVYFSRQPTGAQFFKRLKDSLPDMEMAEYHPKLNIKFNTQRFNEEQIEKGIMTLVPSIGLGLKYFERYNKTLSLTKVKKKIGPIVNRFEIGVAVAALAVIFLLYGGIVFYLKSSVGQLDKQVTEIQSAIRSLRSGEMTANQRRLVELESQIKEYAKLEDTNYPKAAFLERIVKELPSDVWLDSFTMNEKREAVVRGSAYSQRSIYQYFDFLNRQFNGVMIVGIEVETTTDALPVNRFEMRFNWN